MNNVKPCQKDLVHCYAQSSDILQFLA